LADGRRSILETHHKTSVVLASFLITVAGWWAWNAFLSGVYAPAPSPYDVRGGFASGFGADPAWWLTLLLVLTVLVVAELGYKAVKRSLVVAGLWKYRWQWLAWWRREKPARCGRPAEGDGLDDPEEWGLELWQEMERDPVVRERLRLMLKAEEDGVEVGEDAEAVELVSVSRGV